MIGTAINLGKLLLDVATMVMPGDKEVKDAKRVMDVASRSYNVINTTSVSQSANQAVIAPLVVIEEAIMHADYMDDVMQIVMLRDITATLTHLALENSTGMGVKIKDIIGSINPNRAGMMALAGCEDLYDGPLSTARKSKEAASVRNPETKFQNTVVVGGKEMPDLKEYVPLAIGRVVNATVYGENNTKIDFPLTFRQIPVPATARDLSLIFSAAKITDGFLARLLMAKSGEITYPELLTGKDIVKEKFRIRNEEMSGYYKEATKREAGNRVEAVRTGVVSFNTLANTFIISSDTANQLELQMGRRFDNPRARRDIFKAVKANTIVVCNEDRGVFTFYTHGDDMAMPYTRKAIAMKASKDTGGGSLADLVKLLNGGM